ncbi:hypothetical protein N9A45_01345 [bacterium]|nr:hypothetical protein [bacterium]
MASIASLSGTPTLGNVNSKPPFSFKSSSSVRGDYGSKPTVAALQNPTLHNKVPETMVNSTARAPLFVRPFQRGYEKHYSEGDILFVRRNDARASSGHNVVANLPVLNYILRTEKKVDSDDLKYDTLDAILNDWNYFGILNNDMDTGSKWQRLLNVNVRGRSRVARLWSPAKGRLRKGDQVWLSFVEKQTDGLTNMLSPNGIREPMRDGVGYIEVIPTMDCCEEFDSAEMSIPIGIVSQVTLKKPVTTSQATARYVTETCKLLERIEVLMRI